MWRQLKREGHVVARCTVARLMRELRLRGVVRGRRVQTTVPDELLERPLDRVNRQFNVSRPNALWVAALEQALYDRHKSETEELIHHSDRGVQYLSIRYAERLQAVGIEPSVGSVGDSYDCALAETINGLYKTEVIRHQGPWRDLEAVEFATLTWVDWFNNRRLFEPIGNVPPSEKEIEDYRKLQGSVLAA